MTEREQELSELLYNIDFACRATVNPQDAVRVIQELCASANIPAIERGRKMNEVE